MIVATEVTNKSLRLTLADRSYLTFLVSAKNNAIAFRPAAFKRDLEAWICRLASAISACLVRPKCHIFDLPGSIGYLALEILEDAKIYARLSYYFDDKDYVSIDTGVRFYNELMLALAKTLEMPFLEGLYIRVKEVDDLEEKEVRETLHFGNVSCDFCVRRECEVKDDILYPKVILDFYDLDDPNAVCKVVLFDEHLKGKSRPIVFPLNKTPRMSKAFHFALGHESLGAHSSASLGVRIAISHRVSSLHNGKSRVSIKSDVAEALLDVYLLPKIKK